MIPIKFILPLNTKLSSNQKDRTSWQVLRTTKAKCRRDGKILALGYVNRFTKCDRLKITYRFYFKDKRRRDLCNFMEAQKSVIDGIFDTLGCDDSQIDHVVALRCIDETNTRCEVVIEVIDNG